MAEVGFPVILDLVDQPCLVVGGGVIASYKVGGLITARADITVVAPEICPALEKLEAESALRIERRLYRPGEAAGYAFITSATGDPAVDGAVSADAKAAGRLINAADDPVNCNVLLPSVARRGPVIVAVSTTGASPALSAWLRRRIEASLPADLEIAATVLAEGRASLRDRGISTEDVGFGDVVGDVVDLVARGRTEEARSLIASLKVVNPQG